MAKATRGRKPSLGDIVALPLPGGKFAFAKVFRDRDLGVYDIVSDRIEPIETVTHHKMVFFQGVSDAPIRSGQWPIIGAEPFVDEDAAWAPPRATGVIPGFNIDPMTLRLSHKGVRRPATLKEVAGLDLEAFYNPEGFIGIVVDRLINGNHQRYQVPK
jgi:hypothetical protein